MLLNHMRVKNPCIISITKERKEQQDALKKNPQPPSDKNKAAEAGRWHKVPVVNVCSAQVKGRARRMWLWGQEQGCTATHPVPQLSVAGGHPRHVYRQLGWAGSRRGNPA